jgi:tetratricopeptide (TPR) repeat protein
MNKIRLPFLILAIAFFGINGYIATRLYLAEKKQEEVKTFQHLAYTGFEHVSMGREEEAFDVYTKAVSIYDKDSRSLSELARLHVKKNEFEQAKRLYLKAYKTNKSDFGSYYNAALCEYHLKNYTKSIAIVEDLMHHHRRKEAYYQLLALNHYALQNKEEAFAYYATIYSPNRVVKGNDESALAKEFTSLKSEPEAKKYIFEYEQSNDIAQLLQFMENYEKDGYAMKALRTAQRILELEPSNNKANIMAAELLFNHGSLEEAYKYAKEVMNPNARILQIRGAGLHRMKKFNEAIEAYEQSYEKKPLNDLLRAMAVCAYALKDVDRLAEYVDRLGENNPGLQHNLMYAFAINSGKEYTLYEKYIHTAWDEVYKLYCLFGCEDA